MAECTVIRGTSKQALTEVADGAVDGVAAGKEELHEPRRDVPAGAGDAHGLPCNSSHGRPPPRTARERSSRTFFGCALLERSYQRKAVRYGVTKQPEENWQRVASDRRLFYTTP